MKRSATRLAGYALCVVVAALLVFGARMCGGRPEGDGWPEGGDGSQPLRLERVYAPEYARGFSVERTPGGSTLLKVLTEWSGDMRSETSLFIRRGGEEPPRGFAGEVLEGEAQRIVCLSASYVAMLGAIGCSDRIVGVSGLDFISNEDVLRRAAAGRVKDIGYDFNLDYEIIAALRPDVVLIYGIGGENRGLTDKLSELGVKYCYISDYLEQHPLAKAEWIVAVGEICGRGAEARDYFAVVRDDYLSLCGRDYADTPEVMFNTPYKDVWYMPDDKNYIVRFVEDAGGRYAYANSSGRSLPVSAEEAYVYADRADVWLNPGMCDSLDDLVAANPRFAGVKPVRAGRVYNCNRRRTAGGGSDFWESGVVMPHVVLRDLIWVLHPEAADSGYEPYFYKRLE